MSYYSFIFTNVVCSSPHQVIAGDYAYQSSTHVISFYKELTGLPSLEIRRRKCYNRVLSASRKILEWTIGSIKMRFLLLKDRMNLTPRNIGRVMMSCTILQNFMSNCGLGCLENVESIEDID